MEKKPQEVESNLQLANQRFKIKSLPFFFRTKLPLNKNNSCGIICLSFPGKSVSLALIF